MKLLLSGLSETLLRYLLPKFIRDGDKVYITDNIHFPKVIKRDDFDYVLIDVDFLDYDIFSYISDFSIKSNWIFYSYKYDDKYIETLQRKGVKCALSKNIHPDYLYLKIRSIIDNKNCNFMNLRRKYYRAEVESSENVRATLYLPTIKNPINAKIKQLSILGMHILLHDIGDYILIRENTVISNIFLKLNGYRLELTGYVIKKSITKGVIVIFESMDNFARDHIGKYIFKKMEYYVKSLNTATRLQEQAERKNYIYNSSYDSEKNVAKLLTS